MSVSKDILRKYGIIAALKYRCFKLSAPIFYKYNLALPFKYRFVIVSSHGVGHNALVYFFANQNIHCSNRYLKSGYKRYCEDFNMIGSLPCHSIISLSEHNFEDYAKYTRLIQARVPALVLVRDPISTLKSYLNVAQPNKNLTYCGGGGAELILWWQKICYVIFTMTHRQKNEGLAKHHALII